MNDFNCRGGKPSREQVIKAAGDLYDMSPAIAASGARESYINSRLLELELEPEQLANATNSMGAPIMTASRATMEQQFNQEYDQNAELYSGRVTKADYVRSRMIDEGIESHANPKAVVGGAAQSIPAVPPALLADPANAKFVAEFDQAGDVYPNMGISKEAYVKSRRIDEGLDRLSMFRV